MKTISFTCEKNGWKTSPVAVSTAKTDFSQYCALSYKVQRAAPWFCRL